MKRVLPLLLVLAICFTLFSGCGKSDSEQASGNSTGNAATSSSTNNTDIKAELSFMCMGTASTDKADFETVTLPKLVKEKFPNITINTQKLPDEQFKTTFKAKMASGEGPDLYYYWPLSLPNKFLASNNYAKDLTGLKLLDNFNKSVLDAFADSGKIYGIPSIVQLLGTYYNKDMFQKAGITDYPKDWASFLDACAKLKAQGITPIVMGDKDNWVIQFGLYQLAASSIYPKDKDYDSKLMGGQAKFVDQPWSGILTKYKELYDKGYVISGSLGIGSTQAVQLFIDGKAAMIFDGSWDYSAVIKKGAAEFERGFFPLPGNEKGESVAVAANPGTGTYVNGNSKNLDAVMQVIEYWYDGSSPLFKAWSDAYKGQVPAYNGLTMDAPELQDFYKQFQSGANYGFCNNNWVNGVADVLCQKFQGIIAGQGSVEETAKAMDDKTQQVLKQGN